MKILITGCAGFIGFHLAQKLIKLDFEVFGLDSINDYYDQNLKNDRINILNSYDNFNFTKIDLSNKNLVEKTFKKFSPNRVVHLAAQAGVRYSLKNPYAYIKSNLDAFFNVIEMCNKGSSDGLIYASSSSVYGENTILPYNTTDRVDSPLSLYGATKRSNELIAYSYSKMYGLNTTGLRFFTVYGPWYRPDMAIFKFTKKILNGDKITVYNDGKMKRDFTYIDDIVNGTVSAMKKNFEYEIFNLGNEKSENLMDLIGLIERNVGLKAKLNFEPIQNGDMIETLANIDHSKKMLNYSPVTDIKDGIPVFIDWFRSYYDV